MNKQIASTYGSDPIQLFQQWHDEAAPLEPNDPDAICLATSDKDGHPSARMLLLKDISQDGFKFHTNTGSEKGQDILSNPHVSFCMYWKSTRKQIRVVGTAAPVSDAESDEYYKTRPRARAIGAWASKQSQGFDDQNTLTQAIAEAEARFEGQDEIPRPPEWKGFRIIPTSIEFWIGNRDRLHTRFIYRKTEGGWDSQWLFP